MADTNRAAPPPPGSSTQRRCGGTLRRFVRSAQAMSGVEFALLAPIFFACMLEVMQLGLYFYTSATIDMVTNKAARRILVGDVQNGNLTQSQFIANIVCPLMPPSFSTNCASTVVINLIDLPVAPAPLGYASLVSTDYAHPGLSRPNPMVNGQFCPGFPGGVSPNTGKGVEVLEIFYPMPMVAFYWPGNSTSLDGNSQYYVSGSATFQNEPYKVTGQTGGC